MTIEYISYKLGIPTTTSWRSFQFNREFKGSTTCLAPNLISDISRLHANTKSDTIGAANIRLKIKNYQNSNRSDSIFEAAESIIKQFGMFMPVVRTKDNIIELFFPGGNYSWPEFYAVVCIYHQLNEYKTSIVEHAMALNELLEVGDLGRCFFLASGLAWYYPRTTTIHTNMYDSYYNTGHWFCHHAMDHKYNTLLKWKSQIPEGAEKISSLPNDFTLAGRKYFLPDNKAKNRLRTVCCKYVGKEFNRDNLIKLYELVCNP